MTLDEDLVEAVDRAARQLRMSRSGFARQALRAALNEIKTEDLEHKHREGYKRKPVKHREFTIWEKEQIWPE